MCETKGDCAIQAFKSYDEAGAVRRIQCLKYLVLATMLMESAVDPFDAQARCPPPPYPVPHLRHADASLLGPHTVTQTQGCKNPQVVFQAVSGSLEAVQNLFKDPPL